MTFFTVLFCFLCYSLHSFAYTKEFHQFGIHHLTHENGLSNNTVWEIHQDKRDFLWIGTDVGISRYDGVHFHNYELIDIEPQAIKGIHELEGTDLLWLKTGRTGEIACFDKKMGRYVPLRDGSPGILENIQELCAFDMVLYALSPTSILTLSYQKESDSICVKADTLVKWNLPLRQLQVDATYLYAIDENNDILIYNRFNQELKILDYNRLGIKVSILHLRALQEHLWINSNGEGIFCYQAGTDELRKIESPDKRSVCWTFNDIAMKDDSTLVAATDNSIYKLEFKGTDFIHDPFSFTQIDFDNFRYDQFVRDRISKLFIDSKNQILWAGTFGKGLVKSYLQDNNINRIELDDEVGTVSGMAQDTHGYIWLATERSGIWKSTQTNVSADLKFTRWGQSDSNGYYCLHKDENGSLWVGDENGKLQWINPLTNKVITYQPTSDDGTPIGDIRKIYLCSLGKLWLVTGKGLFIYDPQEDQCIASMLYGDFQEITGMCEDGDGLMWLGTDKGVRSAIVDKATILLTGGYEDKAGISPSKVLSIYVNRYNQLYIAYSDKTVQTDQNRQNISNIKILHKDIICGHVTCIIDDKSGNTWMGNNMGIVNIFNKTMASYTYTYPERFYHVCQLNDGQLLWNSSIGLMSFNPRVLKKQELSSTLQICDIDVNYNQVEIGEKINGQTILKSPIYLSDKLTLNHNNNNVVFYLTNLNYRQTLHNIEYRLLPDNDQWRSDYKMQIKFSDLAPGNYILEVRLSPINEKEMPVTRLAIHVKRHWANTWQAQLLYFLLSSLFVAFMIFYLRAKRSRRTFYRKKKEMIKTALSEEIKKRKDLEELQRLRNQARYGLIRELHDPLSLIMAPLKELVASSSMSENHIPHLELAYRNAISMQDACKQLLNVYEQAEEDALLHVASYSVSKVADYAIASLHEILSVSPIKLKYDKNDIHENIWIDHRKINYILKNVLSNALRHISYEGNLHFSIFTTTIEERGYCAFQIKDDGKEMIEKSAVFVLSKEEGGDELTKQLHPELGILLMKEYITAHQGDIHIEQDMETGSTVTVYIPLFKEHLEDNPQVIFIEPENFQADEPKLSNNVSGRPKAPSSISVKNKYKLLVVDAHKDTRTYLKMLFGTTYNVIQAENGEEAIKIAQREMPDLIILDIMMPIMDGFECCRLLKEDQKTSYIPIIFLTALTGDDNMVKAIELGANDYILKPFRPEVLRSKVKRLIQNRIALKQTYMKLMMTSQTKNVHKEEEKEDPFIRQILEIVEKNLQNPDFSVKKLAEMVNMSQPTLYRRVKMLTNYTIIEVIRGVRMKRSAELLKTRKYSIQEVSEMVGYNDTPTFRKHFVDFYGTTPSNFASQEETNVKNSG